MGMKLLVNQPDFKAYEIGKTRHNGKEYLLRQCYEYTGANGKVLLL